MFVDLVVPDMDGFDLVMRFRQIPAFAQTKIVATTGQKGEEYKPSAMKAGFDVVLFNPVALKSERNKSGLGQCHGLRCGPIAKTRQ